MKKGRNSEESLRLISKPCRIISMGKHLPRKVHSSEIEKAHGLPEGWALRFSGVENRHHVVDENVAFLGARAAEDALDKAGLSIQDIDIVISGSASFDQILPCQAALIVKELHGGDDSRCLAFDVNSTCLSFLTAMNVASELIQNDRTKHILIVSSEVASQNLDPKDWETLTLFGDGATAAIIGKSIDGNSGIIKYSQSVFTEGYDKAKILGGGASYPISKHNFSPDLHCFKMNGKELLRLSLKYLPGYMEEFFSDLPFNWKDLDLVVPHQASKTGLNMLGRLVGLNETQIARTLEKYGNCIAVSMPITLCDSIDEGRLKKGNIAIMCGTSAGFAIGALLYKHG